MDVKMKAGVTLTTTDPNDTDTVCEHLLCNCDGGGGGIFVKFLFEHPSPRHETFFRPVLCLLNFS